jgi:2-polyprenyl-6-methoxyphenol hydroxylase-like FAD-dependent oxidoreductase
MEKIEIAPLKHDVDVCIVGGGPAGMVLGLLLAKVGVRVLVLEQHKDFEREYRGEVLMPRFMQMLKQLNLYQIFAEYHHLRLQGLEGMWHEKPILKILFKDIVPESPEALWMAQPFLLDALFVHARQFENFDLWFSSSAKSILWEKDQAVGVIATKEKERVEIRARITVGADGRFSMIRKLGDFAESYRDYHFDIIWFTLPKPKEYDNTLRFFLSSERNILALPKYPNHIQCGLIVPKGEYTLLRKKGIESMRKILLKGPAFLHSFAKELKDFTPFHVLQAELDFIKRWAQDGLLLIGDSAHTCSPVGAVGVSIAVETAIVAADVIWKCLKEKNYSEKKLREVQDRREKDVREIHQLQKRFSGTLLSKNPLVRAALPILLPKLVQSPIVKQTLRRLALLQTPLTLDPAFVFEED